MNGNGQDGKGKGEKGWEGKRMKWIGWDRIEWEEKGRNGKGREVFGGLGSTEMEKAHQCIRDSVVQFVPLAELQRGRGGG